MPGGAPPIIPGAPALPAVRTLLTSAGIHRLSPSQNEPMSASARMNQLRPTLDAMCLTSHLGLAVSGQRERWVAVGDEQERVGVDA
jgi:hypothetical protein